MKTIGLLGGMSWESSSEYYRIINQAVQMRLGGVHSAQCLLYSLDFAEVEALQQRGDWQKATTLMIDAARRLERGGADFILICTNTMHKMAAEVEAALGVPLLHIADAAAAAVKSQGLRTVGLLGTRFTMEETFYSDRLTKQYGLQVLIPEAEERRIIHDVIYSELVVGTINPDSRTGYTKIIEGLVEKGAEGIILGCTEIGLLIRPEDVSVPVFDTTLIHAQAAVEAALA